LTGLGKWWGRKPLILCRAILLGLLLPAGPDPAADLEVFLRLLTMDEAGLRRRLRRPMDPAALAPLSYREKLAHCLRPEQVEGPSAEAWAAINAYLGTSAGSLPELVGQLGQPRVGDSFAGGGSVVFEAARLGFEVFASDQSPVAGLLTWSALHLLGGGPELVRQIKVAQENAFAAVDRQLTTWGVEHNGQGDRADAFLYCTETVCPGCGWRVPLAASWVIAEKTGVAAILVPDVPGKRFDLAIQAKRDPSFLRRARAAGTVRRFTLTCPHCQQRTPLETLRGPDGLRRWGADDLVPHPDDPLQERLYCVRWVRIDGRRVYAAPTPDDHWREALVLRLLRERWAQWQAAGFIPRRPIPSGLKTDEPLRARGWAWWHQLFHPRQLLQLGLFTQEVTRWPPPLLAAGLLLLGRLLNWNARLCHWLPTQGGGIGGGKDAFDNQALNPLHNFGVRGLATLASCRLDLPVMQFTPGPVTLADCRDVATPCTFWITDPPYADAVVYHELAEFFLAWYEPWLPRLFPDWPRALPAPNGRFRASLAAGYANLARLMPDDGVQVILFAHPALAVWADLVVILQQVGLAVTAAWYVRTETDIAGIKKGNHVQGTAMLVLRKRQPASPLRLAQLHSQIETEVSSQLVRMRAGQDTETVRWGPFDCRTAGCAAALPLLTRRRLEGVEEDSRLLESLFRIAAAVALASEAAG
jgi:adenine-specific DNA methylase